MNALRDSRLAQGVAFLIFNALLATLVLDWFVLPFFAQFGERSGTRASLMADFERVVAADAHIKRLSAGAAGQGDPFLAARDERIASADLQALLQRKARDAGTRFLSVRSVTATKTLGARTVAARLDIEGSAASVQAAIADIEGGRPLLFVTSATLRRDSGGMAADLLHAELVVEASMRRPQPSEASGLRGSLPASTVAVSP